MQVTLRPLALDDVDAVHDWARLPEACRYQGWGPNTYEQTQAYVHDAVASMDRLVFAVVSGSDVVGNAVLRLRGSSSAEIAYIVHPRLYIRDGWRDSDLYARLADDRDQSIT